MHVFRSRLGHDIVSAISLIGNQMLRWEAFNQSIHTRAIRRGTRCNKDSGWHTMLIHGQMQLGVKHPLVRPIASLPPVAPAAWG